MATIDGVSVRPLDKVERTSIHGHIRGLGLSPTLDPSPVLNGMAGQMQARKAAGIIVKMIKEGRISGRAILISGPVGSGKTAIAMGISKELGDDTPFVTISGTEVYSKEVSAAEKLVQSFRKAIAVKIREETEIIEAEVVSIDSAHSMNNSEPLVGRMTLKTTDMESVYEMGAKLMDKCIKEQISPGDIIQIDNGNGKITRLGKSAYRRHDFDALGPAVKFLPTPEGEIRKKISNVHSVSLHEIDVINSRTKGYEALFTGETGEISNEVREQITKKVCEWRSEGKAMIVPGVLFIDEVHLLSLRCFSFLNRLIEGDLAPLLIVATNAKGMIQIRDSNVISYMGIPRDFLDRSLLIKTKPYSYEELRQIIILRAEEEDVKLTYVISRVLAELAFRCGLRYALQLVAIAEIARQRDPNAKDELNRQHVCHAATLFNEINRLRMASMQKRKQFAIERYRQDVSVVKEKARLRLLSLPGDENKVSRDVILKKTESLLTTIKTAYMEMLEKINESLEIDRAERARVAALAKEDAKRCGHIEGQPIPKTIIF